VTGSVEGCPLLFVLLGMLGGDRWFLFGIVGEFIIWLGLGEL